MSAEPATIESVLRELIVNPARRAQLGAAGPAYVRRYHDTQVVGRTLLAEYRKAFGLEPYAGAPRPVPERGR